MSIMQIRMGARRELTKLRQIDAGLPLHNTLRLAKVPPNRVKECGNDQRAQHQDPNEIQQVRDAHELWMGI